jgi:nucleoside-diphosphate-sugar epimerase
VHIEDISLAFLAVLHSPVEKIHNEAYNVGLTSENYQMKDVARIVEEVVPGSKVTFDEGAGPDKRCYKVSCDKIVNELPEYQPRWTVRKGVEQLYEAYKAHGLTLEEFESSRYLRIKHIDGLQQSGQLDAELRWASDMARSRS